jgi:hypothetical protein
MTITIIIEDEGATAYDGAIGFWILFQQIHIVQSSWLVASIAHPASVSCQFVLTPSLVQGSTEIFIKISISITKRRLILTHITQKKNTNSFQEVFQHNKMVGILSTNPVKIDINNENI